MVGGQERRGSGTSGFFPLSEEEISTADLLHTTTNTKRPAGWRAMPFILGAHTCLPVIFLVKMGWRFLSPGNETFERLASFGLMANFMVYLQREYHMNQVQAATILNGWSGASNFAPVIGAFVSDAFIGKFWTIVFGSFSSLLLNLPADGVDRQFYDPPLKRGLLLELHLTRRYSCFNKAALIEGDEVNCEGVCVNPWRLCSVQQVQDVKCLVNIIPIWLTSILGFLAMNQQGTFTVSQALKMDLHFGPYIEIPAGSVGVITLIAIAVWLPFYDRVLVPALEKITKQEGGITLLQRIGIGNLFSILT
ncbi:Proton-dependent oligopeptide transporter family - like 10, partial [Theobroma cacao]